MLHFVNKSNLKLRPTGDTVVNKRQRIPKGQSKMDNPEKPATRETHDKEKTTTTNKQKQHYM